MKGYLWSPDANKVTNIGDIRIKNAFRFFENIEMLPAIKHNTGGIVNNKPAGFLNMS